MRDGKTVKAKDPYFATPKARTWLAVPKSKTEIRRLVIRGEKTEQHRANAGAACGAG